MIRQPFVFAISLIISHWAVSAAVASTQFLGHLQWDMFRTQAQPVEFSASTASLALTTVTLGPLRLTTNLFPLDGRFQQAPGGLKIPRTLAGDRFEATVGRPIYGFGFRVAPPTTATSLTFTLSHSDGESLGTVALLPNQSFVGVWSDRVIVRVKVTQASAAAQLVYNKFYVSGQPHVTEPNNIRRLSTMIKKPQFLAATSVAPSGRWPEQGSGPSIDLVGPQGAIKVEALGDGNRLATGTTVWGEAVDAATEAARSPTLCLLRGSGYLSLNTEHFRITLPSLTHSFGFEMVEPTEVDQWILGPSFTFQESTFRIRLFRGAQLLPGGGAISFSPANNQVDFCGVQSRLPFDRIEIQETSGGGENEIFGQLYIGPPAITGGF
jgi:hypothetical protein